MRLQITEPFWPYHSVISDGHWMCTAEQDEVARVSTPKTETGLLLEVDTAAASAGVQLYEDLIHKRGYKGS